MIPAHNNRSNRCPSSAHGIQIVFLVNLAPIHALFQRSTVIGIMFGQGLHTIGSALFSVKSLEFELMSDTHELNTFFSHFAFQVFPIVTPFGVVLLVIDGTNNVSGQEPLKKTCKVMLLFCIEFKTMLH